MAGQYDQAAIDKLKDRPKLETMADLKALTVDEINEYWTDVQSILRSGKPPRKSTAPETLEDVKTMGRDAIIEHWDAVVKILEKQAAIDEAERRAKAAGEASR